jgi:hypothetical protein
MYLSHTLDKSILDRFEKLERESHPRDDVFFAYDATDATDAELQRARDVVGDSLRLYRESEVLDVDYPDPWTDPEHRSFVPGNLDLLYLYLSRLEPDYERYWFVEYDVAYTGTWSDVFDAVTDSADVIGTTLHPYDLNPDWPWWSSLDPSPDVDRSEWVRGFFPLLGLSQEALDCVDEGYRAGWSGHAEVVIPTLASHHGLELEDIGSDGPYVREENRNRFYTNSPEYSNMWPGTFIYRPARLEPGDEPDTLWHPVKQDRDTLRYWGRLIKQGMKVYLPTR